MSALICAMFMMALPALGTDVIVETLCPSKEVSTIGTRFFGVFDNTCFMFHIDEEITYEDALRKCQRYNGTLAMPKIKSINDFLLTEMKRLDQRNAMWIGMHDKETNGVYYWEDGTKARTGDNLDWANGLFGWAEDCIALNPKDGKWHDYRCSDNGVSMLTSKLSYICQFPVKSNFENNDKTKQDTKEKDVDNNQRKGAQVDDDQRRTVIEDNCDPFNCPDLDCGMNGFKIVDGCQKCECATGS